MHKFVNIANVIEKYTLWPLLEFTADICFIVFSIFLYLELIKIASDFAMKRQVTIDQKILTWGLVSLIGISYQKLVIWSIVAIKNVCIYFYTDFDKGSMMFIDALRTHEADLNVFDFLSTTIFNGLLLLFGGMISIILMLLIDVLLITSFFSFGIALFSGYFFLPFFLSDDMKNVGMQWLYNIIAYFMIFPGYALVFKGIVELQKLGLGSLKQTLDGIGSFAHIYQSLLLPFLCFGLLMMVPKVVRNMISAGQSHESGPLGAIAAGGSYLYMASIFAGRAGGGKSRSGKTSGILNKVGVGK